jgi:hypothetical protein
MPLPITNTEAAQRSKAKQYLGSFWNTTFTQPSQVLALSNLPRQTPMIGDFKSVFYDLAGDHINARRKTFVTVYFKTDQIIKTGTEYFDDQFVTTHFGTNYEDSNFSFNFYRLPYSALQMGPATPVRIQASGRTLALGIDFFLDHDFIFFRQDPTELFPQGYYTVVSGIDTAYRPIMADFLGINVPEYQDIITQYVKKYQTPGWFKLAASAAAGMVILRQGGKLIDTQTSPYGTVYVFEEETVRVSYEHTPLVVGNTYVKHYVIGDGLQILFGDPGTRWWRQVDWRGGISLDPLIPTFKGLQLLDQDTYAFVAGSDAASIGGSKAHVRLDMNNADWQREMEYWDGVSAQETALGFYLNNVIGLLDAVDSGNPALLDTFDKLLASNTVTNDLNTELGWPLDKPDYAVLPDKLRVNALDVFFQAVLSDVAVVVYIDPTRIGDLVGLYAFLRAEMTPGAVPLIVSFPPALAGDLLDNTNGVLIEDTAVFYAFTYLLVTDTVDAANIITDSAVFLPETPWLNIN